MTRAFIFILSAALIAAWFWHAFPGAKDESAMSDIGSLTWLMLLVLTFCGGVSAYRYRQIWLPVGVVIATLFSTNYVEWRHACCMPLPPWDLNNIVFSCLFAFLAASAGWLLGSPVRKFPWFRSHAS